MNLPKVTVGVLLFKSEKYLAHSLPSLLDQDYENVEFIFRDQSPNGEIYDYLMHAHPEFFKKAKIKRGKNLMHSGGHNTLIREALRNGSDYYICASNDMLYPNDLVSHIIRGMEGSEPRHYVATCKLMQWDYEKVLAGDLESSKTGIVDSYGIGLTKSHHFYDIGQGSDENEIAPPTKMLGPSAALAVYHKDALEAIAYRRKDDTIEYFDENLHHKNDIDLSYRLRWAGFSCYLAKDVKVYHDRQVGKKGSNHLEILKKHHEKAEWVLADSLKGQLITVWKNFDKGFSFSVKCRTKLNQVLRFIYALMLRPKLLRTYREVWRMKSELRHQKGLMIKNIRTADIEALMS